MASHLHNPMPLPPVNDLTCIVTGSTSGIGLEIARQRKLVEEVFLVQLQPGWKKGTKLMYLEKGYELENHRPADLVLFIYEELHRVYTRDGEDLVVLQIWAATGSSGT